MDRKCAASDCDNKIGYMAPSAKFCSDKCRWRESKRNIYKKRSEKGLCIQCGGKMISPAPPFKTVISPSYCTKCQEYYHSRYKNRS